METIRMIANGRSCRWIEIHDVYILNLQYSKQNKRTNKR